MSHFTLLFKRKFDFEKLKKDEKFEPIGNRDEVIEMIKRILPEIDFADEEMGFYNGEFGSFVVSLGSTDMNVISIGIRNAPSDDLVNNLCKELNLYAFDSSTGEFTN
ncbi:MAG: hypothetical protein H7246_04130 [Phycisphaerae bacterium]|nr:hypothetical protein [Saprospiraceae bacterium]